MKRFYGMILVIAALVLLVIGPGAMAEQVPAGSDADWEVEEQADDTVVITGYTGEADTVTIPAEIGGKQVCGIGDGAFAMNTVLQNVTVPGTIERIGAGAFAVIRTLTTVTVGQGVKEIGDEAFTDCPNLTSVTLPESGVTALGQKLFNACQKLETVNIPVIAEIPKSMFWDCQGLKSIEIPEGVTAIGEKVFWNCFALNDVTLPESLTSIKAQAFHACTALETITLTSNVTEIDDTAFNDCEYLVMNAPADSVAAQYAIDHNLVPENVVLESAHPYTEDEEHSYQGPEDAKGLLVTFSERTYVYGEYGSDSILVTDAEGGETEYRRDSLAGKTILVNGNSFTLKLTAHSREQDFGFRITDIQALNQDEYNKRVAEINEQPWELKTFFGATRITGYLGFQSEITVPATVNDRPVASIGDEAFAGNRRLTRVTIEEGITGIGNSAFENCINLTGVIIPASAESFGTDVFTGCRNVIVYTQANSAAAQYCEAEGIHCVTINGAVTQMGTDGDITWIVDSSGTLTASGEGNIKDYIMDVFVPWYQHRSEITSIVVKDGITSIGTFAFGSLEQVSAVTLPDSVTSIGRYAFANDTGLTGFAVSVGVTTIGDTAFTGCTGITAFTVAEDNPNYTATDGIIFSKDGTRILHYPAAKQETSYEIPDGTEIIDNNAFDNCDRLTEIVIPDTVTRIGRNAFVSCGNLTEMTVPEGVVSIDEWAFDACGKLERLSLPSTLTEIASNNFIEGTYTLKEIDVAEENTVYSSENGVLFSKDKTRLISYPGGKTNPIYRIPESVTTIDDNAMRFSANLIRVIIPSGVSVILTGTFRACENLKCVVLSEGITEIRPGAFNECTGITDVFYEGTAEAWEKIVIDDYHNNWLTDANLLCLGDARILTLPADTREIGSEAFAGLDSADAIRIPDGVTNIATDFADPGMLLIVQSDAWAQWAEGNGYRWVY